jgi:hypothetical protein
VVILTVSAILRFGFDDVFKTKVISQPLAKLFALIMSTTFSALG